MLGKLKRQGWRIVDDPEDARVIVVNTCSFIEPAVNESVDTILALAQYKKHGECERLIVAGCLPERYRDDISESLPEVDIFLGTGAYDQIEKAVVETGFEEGCLLPNPEQRILEGPDTPRVISDTHMAYVKIAEGCDSRCTYCIIPKLRGGHRSRPLADILAEARHLADSGVKELVLVAQDSTRYGRELTPPTDLGALLAALSSISDDLWIRFLYGHPVNFDLSILKVVAEHENLCPYFDIPVQHADDRILKRMGRHYTGEDLVRLFGTIRDRLPNAALRTSVMVGFPGETEEDVERLIRFIEAVEFDHLGVFTYSDEEDLPSHRLTGHVSNETAQRRMERVMSQQQAICLRRNQSYIDTVQRVLVEQPLEEGLWAARTMYQAPEVDGLTFVRVDPSRDAVDTGKFLNVKITDALEYDLISEALPS